MRRNIFIGLLIGVVAGVIDVIPMINMGLSLNANLSAFSMWVVIGFFLAITRMKIKSVMKGLIISMLVLLPNLFIIGWDDPVTLVPVFIMTLILGSFAGYIYQRFAKETEPAFN